MKGVWKGISRNVLLLGVVSFLNDLSSEMIMPILPMFITALGGTSIAVGVIGGVRDSVSSLLKIASGFFSDKSGRRVPFIFGGYLSSSFFKLLLSFSTLWQHVLVFSGLERVGKGLRTAPRDALISDSMPDARGKAFGLHRALDSLGAILGSFLAVILFWKLGLTFKTILLTAACISFLSLLPLRFVRDSRTEPAPIAFSVSLKSLPRRLKTFILIAAVFDLARFNYMFFILRAQGLFGGKAATGFPILMYILFNVFYTAFSIPLGELSDRIGRKNVLMTGYALFSLTALGFSLVPEEGRGLLTIAMLFLLFSLYGITHAAIDANQRAFVADLSPRTLRATALGTYHAVIGIVELPASIIAGFLWQRISPAASFLYGACGSMIAVVLFAALGKYLRE